MTRRGFAMRWLIVLIALFALPAAFADEVDDLKVQGPTPFDAIPAEAVSPFGGLSISPTRLVLESGQTSAQVSLFNSSGKTVTYRIETVELEALAEGGYGDVAAEEVPDWSAARWLRYAPRQVTLEAGERQVVKIMARAPRTSHPGEYRSHLRFSSIPTVKPVEKDEPSTPQDDGADRSVAVSVGLEYRVTIPVILRLGTLEAGTEIVSATQQRAPDTGKPQIAVTLRRTGERSDYGVVRVLDAAGEELGLIRGISVLAPLATRVVTIPLSGSGTPAQVVYEIEGQPGEAAKRLSEAAIR
jgi:fimbrial chaperone protein